MAGWRYYEGYDDDDDIVFAETYFQEELADVMAEDMARGIMHRTHTPEPRRTMPDPIVKFTNIVPRAGRISRIDGTDTFDTSLPGNIAFPGVPRETPTPRPRLVRRATDAYAPRSFSREWDRYFAANADNVSPQ